MLAKVNLRQLEERDIHLRGEILPEELDLGAKDELVNVEHRIVFDCVAERLSQSVYVHGRLKTVAKCECARCLKPFELPVMLEDWCIDLPLEGEEKVAPGRDDCVDLTPFIREDILLALPQHPLCEPGCGGLPYPPDAESRRTGEGGRAGQASSPWAELNKLKFGR